MADNVFVWLQDWFVMRTNGEWEEEFGITIESASNPGWRVEIDLAATPMADAVFPVIEHTRGPGDWLHCRTENEKFIAPGGSRNLIEIIEIFRTFVLAHSRS